MLSSECAGHGGHRDLSYAGPGRRTIPLDIWGCRGDLAQFGVAAASVLGFAKAWQHDTIWSETAAMLAYSKLGKDLSVPSTVKVMESITPYGCVLQVLLLLFLYTLCLSFLILAGNLLFSGNRGIVLGLLYSMYGVLLDPRVLGAILHKEEYEMYQINILIGWVSPLSHVTYAKHNFGYDRLPTVGQSCLLFTGILLVLSVICIRAMRRYSFRFLGERS